MKIRTKIFMANTLVAIILLGSLTFLTTRYSSNLLIKKMEEDVGYAVSQLAENVDNMLQSYEQVVDAQYANTDLKELITKRYDSYLDSYEVYLDHYTPSVNWVRASLRNVLRVMVYTDNPTFQFADVKLIDDSVRQAEWYKMGKRSDKPLVKTWTYLGQDMYYRFGVFRLTQKASSETNGGEMYMAIDLADLVLYDLVAKENEKQRFIIVLPDGHVVVDNYERSRQEQRLSDYPFHNQLENVSSYSGIFKDEGKQYLLSMKELGSRASVRGLKVINLTPIDELRSKVSEMQRIAVILFIAAMLASVMLMYAISTGLTKRLMVLVSKIRRTNTDNLQSLVEIKGNDEISQLGHVFNDMMQRMDKLIKDMYEAEINSKELELKTKESELYALQTQINPHYLFNTLNAIRGNLLERGDGANAEIIYLLAQSFRNVLGRGGHIVRLSEELEIVETYLRIQQFRFGERLTYRIEVPKELQRFAVPRLSLQTLVENAIVHALEKSKKKTHIRVYALVLDDERYSVTVADNGPGMSPERLAETAARMNEETDSAEGKSIGLRNIHRRIGHLYGPAYGLRLKSEPGEGLKATIELPADE
ncbi:sensor histidine kinase [Paenibacillus sp. MBLB4367]|uniref:sensor histidine kinase n=1 Tax=Paenibacillus sp. MBLB4367 TaxID=3384767 RepID=UPI00390828A1